MRLSCARSRCIAVVGVLSLLLPSCAQTVVSVDASALTAIKNTQYQQQRVSIHRSGDAAEVMRACFDSFHMRLELAHTPRTPTLRIDLDDADLQTMENVLGWMTNMFFVEREPEHFVGLEDTPANRTQFQNSRTFSLNGLNVDDRSKLQEMLSRVLEVKASTETGTAFTVQGDVATLNEVGQLVALMQRPRPDVLFRIRAYTVTDRHETNVGAEPPETTQGFSLLSEAQQLISTNQTAVDALVSEGIVSSSDTLEIALLLLAAGYTTSDLSNGFVLFGGGLTYMGMSFSSPSVNALLTDTRLREIESTTLRVADRESGTLRIGERYPIKTGISAYYNYSSTTSSWTTTITPTVEYQDMGLTLQLQPRLLGNGQVYLNLEWTNQTPSGNSINDVPVLDRHEFSSTLLMPLNATTVLAGHLDSERVGNTTGLSSNADKNRSGDDILVTITPELMNAAEPASIPAGLAKLDASRMR